MGNNPAKLLCCVFMAFVVVIACTGCKKTEKPYNHRSTTWLNPIYNAGPGSHGGIVQKRGSTVLCALCHGRQLQGENGLPGCDTCHFGPDGRRTPDTSVWQHGIASHETRKSDEAVCNACHDLYRSYGFGPKTCHNCHDGSNALHQTGQPWLDRKSADFHGKSTLQCSSCHDQTTKCATCHFGPTGSKVPQGSSWQHGTTPHASLEPNQAVCNQCHTLNRSYGNSPISCHNCHKIAPHQIGQPWLDSKSADFHGTSTLQCSSCHDQTTKCATCHFGPTGSKVPQGSSWQHGTIPHDNDSLESSQAVCNQCHSLNRSYGNGPISCHDCHQDQASHPLGQPWLDSKSADFHGKSALQCSSCHDQTTKCATCHFGPTGSKVPQDLSWEHGTIPHDSLESYQAVCNQCHTLNRSYGNGPNSCHNCHGDG